MTTLAPNFRPRRAGFSMIELLVVMTIIAALVGIGIPVYNKVKQNSEINGTQALVNQVALAMQAYNVDFYTDNTMAVYKTSGTLRPMWDILINSATDTKWNVSESGLNGAASGAYVAGGVTYGFLDADSDTGANAGALTGYKGFLVNSGASIPKRFVNASNQVVDAWGRRVLVAPRAALPTGVRFGVLSGGPTLSITTDDIKSW